MMLVSYSPPGTPGEARAGVLHGGHVLDVGTLLSLAVDRFGLASPRGLSSKGGVTLSELLEAGQDALRIVKETLFRLVIEEDHTATATFDFFQPLHRLTIEAPISRPPCVREFCAFEGHFKRLQGAKGMKTPEEWYLSPTFYYLNPYTIYGPDATVPYPAGSSALDYEIQVACAIGTRCTDVDPGEAESHIAGLTIVNSWTARDVEEKEGRIGLGLTKAKDFALSLGPYLVTSDELEANRVSTGKYDLVMTVKVNGKEYSRGNLKDMHWGFTDLVAEASKNVTLQPGDMLCSGVMAEGCILDLDPQKHGWLKQGDLVELEVDKLGRLVNIVGPPVRQKRSQGA